MSTQMLSPPGSKRWCESAGLENALPTNGFCASDVLELVQKPWLNEPSLPTFVLVLTTCYDLGLCRDIQFQDLLVALSLVVQRTLQLNEPHVSVPSQVVAY